VSSGFCPLIHWLDIAAPSAIARHESGSGASPRSVTGNLRRAAKLVELKAFGTESDVKLDRRRKKGKKRSRKNGRKGAANLPPARNSSIAILRLSEGHQKGGGRIFFPATDRGATSVLGGPSKPRDISFAVVVAETLYVVWSCARPGGADVKGKQGAASDGRPCAYLTNLDLPAFDATVSPTLNGGRERPPGVPSGVPSFSIMTSAR
jgi:hypothetical protein